MGEHQSRAEESAPLLLVRAKGSDRSLLPGPSYQIGRDPNCDIVINDPRVSRRHAVLRLEDGHWVLADNGSANGIYAGDQRVTTLPIYGVCVVRLGHPADGLVLTCTVSAAGPGTGEGARGDSAVTVIGTTAAGAPATVRQGAVPAPQQVPQQVPQAASQPASPPVQQPVQQPVQRPAVPPSPGHRGEPLEIPYAVRWLVPRGERFANFDILNDNDTQLDYYRKFGHIYAVGIPAKKWRIVVVSDPELLDEVAGNELQFGKRVEDINFFDQLSNSRGGGISVIGDGEHYERIRRVMLPWYAPANQRTQLELMKDQARKLVAGWAAMPDGEPLDARAWMERYTLEVSGRGACKYDFGLLDGSGAAHPFAVAVPESTKESILRVAEPRPDFTLFSGRAKRARRKRYLEHNKELFRAADALVQARRHTCPAGAQTDLLSRLVTTPDPETGQLLDAVTVRDQVLMHLSNGFNGPSITGGWLAYLLATHPDVEEQVIAEIDGITGGDPDHDLQYDDLFELRYTTQVIKEAMRIFPPMPVTIRRSLKDGMLGNYAVRKGDIIFVGTLAAHRDPRYWGQDPDRFDPGQFAVEKVVDRPRHAFIPFSVGKRQCMAQEVTFMMLRVVLYEIYKHYRLRLAPGATVVKNAIVTTKPASVPIVRLARADIVRQEKRRPLPEAEHAAPAQAPAPAPAVAAAPDRSGPPTEIPETSAYRHIVIAYGSNFGANKELAERFAERGHYQGYSCDVVTLNELAAQPARTAPWLLVVMTSTYTSNPPTNAAEFKTWLERTGPGTPTWQNCRYLVWGLGNTQWNAFLAFPRYVQKKLSDLGAAPLADFGYGDVGSPTWERLHAEWNSRVWPALLELSGARPTEAAATREAARKASAGALTSTDSNIAMQRSLSHSIPPGANDRRASGAAGRAPSMSSVMRRMASGSRIWARTGSPPAAAGSTQPRAFLAPVILANAVGMATVEARVLAWRDLQQPASPKQTRHLELSLPPGVTYRVGDHLGFCPKNDQDQVERLANRLGAALDGVFMVPPAMNVTAVPKGVVLQVRNVLTSLIDITGRPTAALVDLLLDKVTDQTERSRLMQVKAVVQDPEGPESPLRTAIDAGGFDVLGLLEEFGSCRLNIYDLLQVAQPLKPRYYSTSSSPRFHGGGVAHVTVGLEATPVPGMAGREFSGMSSRYVHTLREGDRVSVFHDSADGFHLQDDVTKPMIFVSAGTGFAPMRAFLWERLALRRAGAALAEAALFNGIRSPGLDYIYRDEVERLTAEGVLDHVHVAASRERPGRREHVQDRLREQGALVWRLLSAGGYAYVCGSQPMRAAVRSALVDVVAHHGSLPPAQAGAYVSEMETTGRYRPDLWV
ncbi:MAG TPA: cytochrome P450 [Streptosporangiaceae bacterium]